MKSRNLGFTGLALHHYGAATPLFVKLVNIVLKPTFKFTQG